MHVETENLKVNQKDFYLIHPRWCTVNTKRKQADVM